MSKIYSLLRNNKQTGPYSLEELVQLQLKPFDLVWAEGKSAGWRYPSEIDALKPYLAEAGSPEPEVQSLKPVVPSPKPVVEATQPLAVAEENKPEAVAPVVPRNKRPSKAIYVSLPAGTNPAPVAAPVPVPEAKQAPVQTVATVGEASGDGAGEEPKESFEERVERMRRRVAAVESREKVEVEEGSDEINTKYSRSLEDIKEEYSSWMKQQKSKKRFPVKKLLFGAAAVLVLTAGGWMAYAFISNAPAPVPAVQPLAEAAIPIAEKENVPEPEHDVPGDAATRAVIEHLDHTLEVLEANEKKAPAKKKATPVVNKRLSNPVRTTPVPAVKPRTETAAGKTAQEKSASPSTETPRRVKSSVPLSKLVNIQGRVVKARKGIEGVEITLQNNSDQTLKLVAVDVLYHKGNNNVIQRETIYFSDIRPGTSRMMVARGNRNARSANYQLGLISAEDGLYVSR